MRKINHHNNGSIHASSIISDSNPDTREALKLWFEQNIVSPTHFDLKKPELDARQAYASRCFRDYEESIKGLGYTVWDIQTRTVETSSLVLEDSAGRQSKLSGRADFLIATKNARSLAAAPQHTVCVVEIQSKDNEEDCEFQIMSYLYIMMNCYGLNSLAGILVYNNGNCRAYRASRDNVRGVMFEDNDTFPLFQIADILPELLNA